MSKKNLMWAGIIIIAIILSFVILPHKSSAPSINDADTSTSGTSKPSTSKPAATKPTAGKEYLVTGYYDRYTKTAEYDQSYSQTYTCDGFVVTGTTDKATQSVLDLIKSINGQSALTLEGKTRFNLDFVEVKSDVIEKINASSARSPITLRLTENPPTQKGLNPCLTYFKILGVK